MTRDKLRKCIFCLTESGPFQTREHIVPESLFGGDWSIMNDRVVCDSCQNYFGSKIERYVLDDYPFNHVRTFGAIPTKKGKMPYFDDRLEGRFQRDRDGFLSYTPAPHFERALLSGQKTRMSLLAETRTPEKLCQFLVKMGLELISERVNLEVYGDKYNAARKFSRYLDNRVEWFYLHFPKPSTTLYTMPVALYEEQDSEIVVSIAETVQHLPCVIFIFFGHKFIAPLTTHFRLDDAIEWASMNAKAYQIKGKNVKRI